MGVVGKRWVWQGSAGQANVKFFLWEGFYGDEDGGMHYPAIEPSPGMPSVIKPMPGHHGEVVGLGFYCWVWRKGVGGTCVRKSDYRDSNDPRSRRQRPLEGSYLDLGTATGI